MTPQQQRAWDEKIRALKHAGVPMPERAELAKRQLAAEAAARAEPEPPAPGPLVQQPTPCTNPSALVTGEDPNTPAVAAHGDPGHDGAEVPGAEVPGSQLGDAVASSAASTRPKVVKAASGSKKRTGTRRRKTQSRTVQGNTDTMNVSALPEQTAQAPPAEIDDRALLDERRAAERLGLCQRTMYSLRASGELPHIRIRRRIFYRPADIDRFVASQARTDIPAKLRLSEQQLATRSRKKSRGKAASGRRT